MIPEYLAAKYLHVLIAILALGTSAGLGIVLEFYGDHPAHGSFILRAIERTIAFFVLPGYALVLTTGLWMAHLAWPMTAKWIEAALALWAAGAIILALFLVVLHRQIRLFGAEGSTSNSYRRISTLSRALGAGNGLVVLALLYLMIFKPGG